MYLKNDKDPWQPKKRLEASDWDKFWQQARAKIASWGWIHWLKSPRNYLHLAPYMVAGLLSIWLISGIYIVPEGERGVVSRFNAYQETVLPGPHWHWPAPIEKVNYVNVERQRFLELGYRSRGGRMMPVPEEALMLTKDENIVDLRLALQYSIKDADDYLYNAQEPEAILKQITESVTRGVIGNQKMDFVLTEGRSEIVAKIEEEVQKTMDAYRAGIQIASVNLQDAQPPEEVQQAFEDAIKAREDKERLVNEAQAYANEIIPQARGAAARMVAEAEGYQKATIAKAEGEADHFRQILTTYRKNPEVTRRRLAIEAMEEVLEKTDSVVVDLEGNGNVVYLPLDKIRGAQHQASNPAGNLSRAEPPKARGGETKLRSFSRSTNGRGR